MYFVLFAFLHAFVFELFLFSVNAEAQLFYGNEHAGIDSVMEKTKRNLEQPLLVAGNRASCGDKTGIVFKFNIYRNRKYFLFLLMALV